MTVDIKSLLDSDDDLGERYLEGIDKSQELSKLYKCMLPLYVAHKRGKLPLIIQIRNLESLGNVKVLRKKHVIWIKKEVAKSFKEIIAGLKNQGFNKKVVKFPIFGIVISKKIKLSPKFLEKFKKQCIFVVNDDQNMRFNKKLGQWVSPWTLHLQGKEFQQGSGPEQWTKCLNLMQLTCAGRATEHEKNGTFYGPTGAGKKAWMLKVCVDHDDAYPQTGTGWRHWIYLNKVIEKNGKQLQFVSGKEHILTHEMCHAVFGLHDIYNLGGGEGGDVVKHLDKYPDDKSILYDGNKITEFDVAYSRLAWYYQKKLFDAKSTSAVSAKHSSLPKESLESCESRVPITHLLFVMILVALLSWILLARPAMC